ncbi:serine--tRNA ligase [Buchnera aphidicola]|uniref:Serine--tRNA ligase n=1 Tax=Buchnera aphidicola (Sarucallis kahawaluokalani) TaxID=1241878 RepID=A0A4D6YJY0_9GAMM|nr:serine--tRNA ligase [Buchnera aphidicola]QCI26008.1 serine--tRNA ligase [Buchnera aphidicola (Sarucallis kahawaluokalani)]
MLDPHLLRNVSNLVVKKLKNRNFVLNAKHLNYMEKNRKELQIEVEKLRYKYNKLSKIIGSKNITPEDLINVKNKVCNIKKILSTKNNVLKKFQKDIKNFISCIPNIPDNTVPIGNNGNHNIEISYWGKIKNYNFNILDHVELGNKINGFDWLTASKISGSRFVIMKNKIALLYRAIGQFMLDVHTMQHGYLETNIPYLVNSDSMYGTGQLPKFKKELFYVSTIHQKQKNNKYILIPTAEVPLTNLFQNILLQINDLPVMLTAYSPCFRAESLSYGQDTRGLIRMHQFDKVEIFHLTRPEYSMQSLEILTSHAENILKLLKLPYRKILLCTGDLGFTSTKTYDLEVWFPAQNKYREISSCSNMSDFQTRRINAKYFHKKKKKKFLLHTINGSGLAVGRTLAAILENYQNIDGSVTIPDVLRKKYMNGMTFLN